MSEKKDKNITKQTEKILKKKLTRREFLNASLKVGIGLAALPLLDKLSSATRFAGKHIGSGIAYAKKKAGLAPGKIGGPTDFPGCERYQYSADSAAGRAIESVRRLKAAGKAPKKIVFMLPAGAVGHYNVPFPKGAPTSKQVWEEETGIKLEIAGVVSEQQFTKIVQDHTTRAGEYDIYAYWATNVGDLAQMGALYNLDEFVEKYRPEWTDSKRGYVGGETTVEQTQAYRGSIYSFTMDGDYQPWVYRRDLFGDPKEQREFKQRYGWDLQWAETWEQLDQLSEFFTRPEKGLWGSTDLRNQFWGFTNWMQRYTCFASPNQYYFDEDAKPLIYSEAGIKAAEEYVNAMKWHHPDAISWGWPEQYAHMSAGKAAITCAFPNMSKFLDNPDNPDSKVVGKLRYGISPGRIINGKLIRRALWWPSIAHGVSSHTRYPEAIYLFLQWANSPEMFTWMVGNPAGYYDPFQIPNFTDPIVVGSYKKYGVSTLTEQIKRATPPLRIAGANEYERALDTNLVAASAKRKTPEQAMKDTAKEWEKITNRLGREQQIAAIVAERRAWPTIVDTPTIKS